MTSITESDLKRFWDKVDKRSDDECWEWKAGRMSNGYGRFYLPSIGDSSSHRTSWLIHFGAIPDGLFVLHKCDNRPCCNPNHLFLGTQKDNIQDMYRKGRNREITKPESIARGEDHGMAHLTWEDVNWIRSNSENFTALVIAEKFGMCLLSIQKIIRNQLWIDPDYTPPKRKRIKTGVTSRRGENHSQSKINWEIVRSIRTVEKHVPNPQLSIKYGVSRSLISMIKNNKVWFDESIS